MTSPPHRGGGVGGGAYPSGGVVQLLSLVLVVPLPNIPILVRAPPPPRPPLRRRSTGCPRPGAPSPPRAPPLPPPPADEGEWRLSPPSPPALLPPPRSRWLSPGEGSAEEADLGAAGGAGEGYGVCWSSLQGQRGQDETRGPSGPPPLLDDANGPMLTADANGRYRPGGPSLPPSLSFSLIGSQPHERSHGAASTHTSGLTYTQSEMGVDGESGWRVVMTSQTVGRLPALSRPVEG